MTELGSLDDRLNEALTLDDIPECNDDNTYDIDKYRISFFHTYKDDDDDFVWTRWNVEPVGMSNPLGLRTKEK